MSEKGFKNYATVPKIQKSLNVLADVYNEKIRNFIISCYIDPRLNDLYYMKRKMYDDMQHTSGKLNYGKAHRRKILEFPNGHVAGFVDRVMSAQYGPEWIKNKKLYTHEVVRPWLTVDPKFL